MLAITIITFGVTFLSPVDPARLYAGLARDRMRSTRLARRTLGLNHPLFVQYLRYLGRLLHGNLGTSFSTGEPVLSIVLGRLPATWSSPRAGLIVEVVIGAPARLPRRPAAGSGRPTALILSGSLFGVVVPQFVLGFLLLYVLAFKLRSSRSAPPTSLPALVLPALALGLPGAAWYARMVRSSVLNVLGEDFVRNCRAKGLREWAVVDAGTCSATPSGRPSP